MKKWSIRRYLMAGLLVWIPIWVTFIVIRFIVELLDKTISLIPLAYRPAQLFGVDVPGMGVVFSLLLLIFTGLFVTNIFGAKIISWGEAILARIPLVRSIYQAVKQVLSTVLSSNSQAFRRVLLVEYPRKGMWSIAFQTGETSTHVSKHVGVDMLTIFIPTTPNPTSGFLMMVPKADALELDMSVDEALKMVISLGVMQPTNAVLPSVANPD